MKSPQTKQSRNKAAAIYCTIVLMVFAGIIGIICFHCLTIVDGELYFYGYNRLDRYPPLIADARPLTCVNDHLYGYERVYSDGFSIASSKSKYVYEENGEKSWCEYDLFIDSICSYGYNDSVLVAELMSEEGNRYFVVTGFDDVRSKIIRADTCCICDPSRYFKLSKWICETNHPPIALTDVSAFLIKVIWTVAIVEFLCGIVLVFLIIHFLLLKKT